MPQSLVCVPKALSCSEPGGMCLGFAGGHGFKPLNGQRRHSLAVAEKYDPESGLQVQLRLQVQPRATLQFVWARPPASEAALGSLLCLPSKAAVLAGQGRNPEHVAKRLKLRGLPMSAKKGQRCHNFRYKVL